LAILSLSLKNEEELEKKVLVLFMQ